MNKRVFKTLITADFETTYSNFKNKQEKESFGDYFKRCPEELPEVYSWDIFDGQKHIYGIDIKDFISFLQNAKKKYICYFHNGAKFDLHFLIPELHKEGYHPHIKFPKEFTSITDFYTHSTGSDYADDNIAKIIKFFLKKAENYFEGEKLKSYKSYSIDDKMFIFDDYLKNAPSLFRKIINKKDEKTYDIITDKGFKILSLTFYSNFKSVRKVKNKKTQKWERKEGRPYTIEFKDSNLLVAGSLVQYGQILNKKYKTDKYTKLELSTGYLRGEKYKSLKELENDGNELEYLKQDTFILYSFINDLINSSELLTLNNLQITSAGTAYKLWKYGFFGEKVLKEQIKKDSVKEITLSKGMKRYDIKLPNGKKKSYTSKGIKDYLIKKHYFPKMYSRYEDWVRIFQYYQGGLTFTNPIYRGVPIKDVFLIDINGSYSNAMYNFRLPKLSANFKVYNKNYFQLIKVILKSDLYNEKGLPFIQAFNGNRKPYSKKVLKKYNPILYLNSYNFEQFKKYYKGKYNVVIETSYQWEEGSYLFREYIDYWKKVKEEAKATGDAVMYAFAKVMLNSLYGKFGTKRLRESKVYINGEWLGYRYYSENEYYLPLAIAITTIGRMSLVDLVGENYKLVIGGDTDSILVFEQHIENIKKYNNFDKYKLGAWDVELEYGKGVVRRPKQYFFRRPDNSVKMAYAGVHPSKEDLENFEVKDFIVGKKIYNQKSKTNTPTGVSIFEVNKDILPIWNEDYINADKGMELWYYDGNSYINGLEEQKRKIEDIKKKEWV